MRKSARMREHWKLIVKDTPTGEVVCCSLFSQSDESKKLNYPKKESNISFEKQTNPNANANAKQKQENKNNTNQRTH